ncbi:MAG: hypothetical protein ACRDD5_01255 [Silvania sp.]|uniref:hypothetical protein n=1 Tax=Silvania sp. TaxID=3016633 RepID=UPI003EE4D9C3
MTANKPMTGEQLDELMTVAVHMQRDAEIDCNRPSANFAYAVQVAVLELRKFRGDFVALAAEPVADVVAWSKPGEERKCDIRWRRHDVAPGPLYSFSLLSSHCGDPLTRD